MQKNCEPEIAHLTIYQKAVCVAIVWHRYCKMLPRVHGITVKSVIIISLFRAGKKMPLIKFTQSWFLTPEDIVFIKTVIYERFFQTWYHV